MANIGKLGGWMGTATARGSFRALVTRHLALVTVLLLSVLGTSVWGAGGSLIYPHLISGMGFETRLVVRNGSGETARVVLTARGDDGRVLGGAGVRNPAVVTVGGHQEVEVEAGELFGLSGGELRLGWVQGESDNAQVTGQLYASTAAQGRGAGVEVSGRLETQQVGVIPVGMQTAMALANPNGVQAAVVVRLYDAAGRERGERRFTIAAQGHRAEFLSEGTGGVLEGGHYEVESSVGLSGMMVLTGVSGYTVAGLGKAGSGTLVFARVENGGLVGTTLAVANASGVGMEVEWQAYDEQGRAVWEAVRSRIGPHGTLQGNVGVLLGQGAGAEFRGWVEARVTASAALEGVQAVGWALYAEGTGVESLEAQRGTAGVVLLRGSGWLLNPGGAAGTVSVVGYGGNGKRIGSRTAVVGARRRVRLSELAPAGSEMVLLRGTAAVVGYEEGVDGSGVSRAQGGAEVPAATGAVELNRELGGVVVAGDARARVEVPLGALSADTEIAIESLRLEETPRAPSGRVVVAAVRVSPLGLRFGQPVRVEMPVLRTAPLGAGTRLQVYNPQEKEYEETPYEVRSGVGGTTVVTEVREFPSGPPGTVWVVLGIAEATPASGGGGGGGGGGVVSSGGSGGVVTSSDGQTAAVVPPGAVPQSTTITVENVAPGTLPPPPNQQTVLLAAEVGPSGTQFQTPVVLEFQVPVALQGRLPRQLPVGIYNPLTSQYETTGFTAVLSPDGAKLTASVTHFTVFVILQPFTPFASPTLPSGTSVKPLGIVSVDLPAIVDTTPPTVTINQAAGQLDPTSASPINFTVVFNEPVTGFATGDVTLVGTAGATTATVTGGPTTFNVAVSGMTQSGDVIAEIANGVATDLAGNPNEVSTSTDNTVTFDIPAPDLTVLKTHVGNFVGGQTGATYTITVTNVGTGASSGTVTVVDTLPADLAATAISGTGWSCTLATLTCTRSDALAATLSYPPITLTVSVSPSALTGRFFGSAYSGGGGPATLYDIIPADGAFGSIGLIGFNQVSGLDFSPSGILFGGGQDPGDFFDKLITVDPFTGVGTAIGPTGLSDALHDLSFRPSDGTLFATSGCGDCGDVALYTVNTSTGTATAVGASFATNGGNGLAFSSSNVLYSVQGSDLNTLDQTTGVPTLVTTLDFSAFPVGPTYKVNGMTFDPLTGTLYAAVNGSGTNYLGTINISTGVVSNVGTSVTRLDALAIDPPRRNAVTVSGGGEVNTANNTSSDPTNIGPLPADLQMFPGFDAPDPVTSGEVTSLSFFMFHNGSQTLTNSNQIVVTLPAGMSFNSCFPFGGTAPACSESSPGVVTATFGDLPVFPTGCTTFCPPEFFAAVSIDVTVSNPGPDPLFLEVTGVASTTTPELNPDNNVGSTTVTVNPVGGLVPQAGGPPGGDIRAFAQYAASPDVIYAAAFGAGVFKTTGYGENWIPVNSGLTELDMLSVAVAPDTGTVYAGNQGGGIFRSTDGGLTWTNINGAGLRASPLIRAIVIDPNDSNVVYVADTGGGVFKTSDASVPAPVWAAMNTGIVALTVQTLVMDPFDSNVLYAGTFVGVSRSADGGASWTTVNSGLTTLNVTSLAVDPFDPTIVFAGTQTGGVFKSVNSGGLWAESNTSLNLFVRTVNPDPLIPNRIFAGTAGGVFRSTDGGANWVAENAGLDILNVQSLLIDPSLAYFFAGTTGAGVFRGEDDGSISWSHFSTGLAASVVRAVAVDPGNPNVVYAALFNGGVSKSVDGGATWSLASNGLPTSSVQELTFEPGNSSVIYAATNGSSVFKTTDAGVNWLPSNSGLPTGINEVVVDPNDTTVVYAATIGSGVYQSTDSGATWNPVNGTSPTNIVPGSTIRDIVLDPAGSPSIVYAGTGGAGVYKSTDAGATWTAVNSGLGANLSITALLFDSSSVFAGTNSGGVFRTDNGGSSWVFSGTGLTDLQIDDLDVDLESVTYYAVTVTGGVFQSSDGGVNWSAANTGLPGDRIFSLSLAEGFSTQYVGTNGKGVFKSTDNAATWSPTGAE